jgi:hypothetical protein
LLYFFIFFGEVVEVEVDAQIQSGASANQICGKVKSWIGVPVVAYAVDADFAGLLEFEKFR